MIDLGVIEPQATLGPTRTSNGTVLGRATTSEEQRAEVIAYMEKHATKERAATLRAQISWARGEATILEISYSLEHIDGKPVRITDKVVEQMLNGSEVPQNEEARLRKLKAEIAEMHEDGTI